MMNRTTQKHTLKHMKLALPMALVVAFTASTMTFGSATSYAKETRLQSPSLYHNLIDVNGDEILYKKKKKKKKTRTTTDSDQETRGSY